MYQLVVADHLVCGPKTVPRAACRISAPFLLKTPSSVPRRRRCASHASPRAGGQVQLNPLERVVNAVTVLITNSPLHEGKKKFFTARAGRYDEVAVRAKLEGMVANNPAVVFSWTFCPFAQKAKALLSELGAKYVAVELDQDPDGKALRAELIKRTNRTSVPFCFIGGQFHGGCNDGPGIFTLQKQGKLMPLLRQARAV